MARRFHTRNAFTIIELVLSLTVCAAIAVSMSALYSLLFVTDDTAETVFVDGEPYPILPSISAMRDAGALNTAFAESVASADAVFVIGGGGRDPLLGASSLCAALQSDYWPESFSAIQSCSTTAFANSLAFRLAADDFVDAAGDHKNLTASSSDFSVVCIADTGTEFINSAILHVRRYTTKHVDGREMALYRVVMRSGAGLPADSELSYRFAIPTEEDVWLLSVGAYHKWFRYDAEWRRYEEGPCEIVLPDPYMLNGSTGVDTAACSRFVYFTQEW